MITDNLAITKHSDPNQTYKIYQEKLKEGKQNVAWTRGVLTEEYPDMKKEEIKKLIVAQLELLKVNMKKEMEIKYTITIKEK